MHLINNTLYITFIEILCMFQYCLVRLEMQKWEFDMNKSIYMHKNIYGQKISCKRKSKMHHRVWNQAHYLGRRCASYQDHHWRFRRQRTLPLWPDVRLVIAWYGIFCNFVSYSSSYDRNS
jgi:hypothetical protein